MQVFSRERASTLSWTGPFTYQNNGIMVDAMDAEADSQVGAAFLASNEYNH